MRMKKWFGTMMATMMMLMMMLMGGGGVAMAAMPQAPFSVVPLEGNLLHHHALSYFVFWQKALPKTLTLDVTNRSTKTETLVVSVMGPTNSVNGTVDYTKKVAVPWLSFAPQTITLAPQQRRIVALPTKPSLLPSRGASFAGIAFLLKNSTTSPFHRVGQKKVQATVNWQWIVPILVDRGTFSPYHFRLDSASLHRMTNKLAQVSFSIEGQHPWYESSQGGSISLWYQEAKKRVLVGRDMVSATGWMGSQPVSFQFPVFMKQVLPSGQYYLSVHLSNSTSSRLLSLLPQGSTIKNWLNMTLPIAFDGVNGNSKVMPDGIVANLSSPGLPMWIWFLVALLLLLLVLWWLWWARKKKKKKGENPPS